MALKRQKIDGKRQVLILSFFSTTISFICVFFSLLPIKMISSDKRDEYIASLVNENVDEKTALMMFNLFTGVFRYLLIISIILIVFSSIILFLLQLFLHKDNKKKIGVFIYVYSIFHILSFRLIGSILLYRQAIKFLVDEKSKTKKTY